LEAVFFLLEFSSPSRRIFIGSHSLPPSLVRRIGPSISTSTATHGKTTTTGARELCTLDIVDLPIINLQDAGRPFKIKISTIRMTIARALERFNEYIRAEFLEWHIGLLKRRMEKMEIEKEAQDLKVAEARSTCEECEEYGHVQGKPQINASLSIQDLVPLHTMEELHGQAS
jgi:hypothetical protein